MKVVRGFSGILRRAFARSRMTFGMQPLSYVWGTDRGLPVHRYYLEQFLNEFSVDISGQCLEFQDATYAIHFGKSKISKLDILHIDSSNPNATLVADLTKPNDLSSNQFDCIICTHVLHVIVDVQTALAELHRILRPNGVLLAAVPHISMCEPAYHEIWRFTPEGLRILLERAFGVGSTDVRAYGNSLTAAGEIRGVVSAEFRARELIYHDARFAVEVCARAIKRERL